MQVALEQACEHRQTTFTEKHEELLKRAARLVIVRENKVCAVILRIDVG